MIDSSISDGIQYSFKRRLKMRCWIADDKVLTNFVKYFRTGWSMCRIEREGVRRNALRVLCPKSSHSEESAQHIEWRDPCGHAAVWL